MTLDADGWSHSRPCRFIPGKTPGTHYVGGWWGPRYDLESVEKRNILVPAGNKTQVFCFVVYLLELWLSLKKN
jgi:hypothetical protein